MRTFKRNDPFIMFSQLPSRVQYDRLLKNRPQF